MNSTRLMRRVAVLALTLAAGCGGGDGSDGGATPDDSSILGAAASSYSEANDAGNSAEAGSEPTGYTLDLEGLRITGTFAASGTTYDYYRFGTGAYTHADAQVFVGGVKQDEQNHQVAITLNAFVNDGYSTLTGNGYFINAWLSGVNKEYVVGISGTPGAAYTLELKGR